MHTHEIYPSDSHHHLHSLPCQPSTGSPQEGESESLHLDRGSPAVSFKTGKGEPSNFVFTFKIELSNLDPLRFHINFRTGLSISARKAVGILIGMSRNL